MNRSSTEHAPEIVSPLLDALFAETPVGLAFWDREFRYVRVNEVLAAIDGVSADAHLGRRVSDVLPALGPQLEKLFADIFATGRAVRDVHISGETPAAAGVTRDWLASYFPVRDEHGAYVGIGGTVVETTGERRASVREHRTERRAEAIDAQLRAVYSALPVGVAFVTPDMRYERVNDALAAMNGLSVQEHVGRTVHEVLGEHGAEAEELTREVIRRQEPIEFELTVRTPASPDEDRFYEAMYFPVFAPGDELLGVGAVVRDITDRHRAQDERERLLRDALTARAQSEAAQVRAEAARQAAEAARQEAERERAVADSARRRASFLATVTRRMASSLDYEATLREVVESAVPYIADWCLVTVAEAPGRLRLLAVAHQDPQREPLAEEFAARYVPGPASSVTKVLRTGEPEIVFDITPERLAAIARDQQQLELVSRLDVRHFGTWPIPSPTGEVIGALSLVLGDSGRRFSQEDIELGRVLATRAGLHIANARLHTERSHIAQTLQASLLPRQLPDIPGVELGSAFVAAGDQNEVGGDFFDVFASGDGVWTAILGDVSGKGAEAAAITAAARYTLRTAAQMVSDPAENLALLNRALLADLELDQFCTVVYARLCPDEDRMAVSIANGGHPPALVLRDDGTIETVRAGAGPLVGVLHDAEFTEASVELRAGDALVLYTDGVTEARTSDVAAGERALLSTLAGCRGQPAPEVADAVRDAALALQNGVPRDDIAVLVVRVPTNRHARSEHA